MRGLRWVAYVRVYFRFGSIRSGPAVMHIRIEAQVYTSYRSARRCRMTGGKDEVSVSQLAPRFVLNPCSNCSQHQPTSHLSSNAPVGTCRAAAQTATAIGTRRCRSTGSSTRQLRS